MDFEDFKREVSNRLAGMNEVTGEVLYTSWQGITEGLPFYIMGINPGGGNQTIAEHLDSLPEATTTAPRRLLNDPSQTSHLWSGYLDSMWRGTQFNPIQTHLFDFACGLSPKLDLPKVCGTNLVFEASHTPDEVDDWTGKTEHCWAVHELLMDIVKPRVVLTFGKEPRDFVSAKCISTCSHTFWPTTKLSGQRHCTSYRGTLAGQNVTVISVPHLGRFGLARKPEMMAWLQELVSLGMNS